MKLGYASLLAAFGALALAGAAHADMSGMVGNTMIVTTPDGGTIRVQMHADGSYQAAVANGPTNKGTWAAQGAQLCYTQVDPAPTADQPQPICVPGMDGHKAGDSWSTAGPNGADLKMTIEAGQ